MDHKEEKESLQIGMVIVSCNNKVLALSYEFNISNNSYGSDKDMICVVNMKFLTHSYIRTFTR